MSRLHGERVARCVIGDTFVASGQCGRPSALNVVTGPGGRRMMVSGGSAIGGTAVLFVFPDDATVVVFLTNMGNAPIRGVPLRVARILFGEERT